MSDGDQRETLKSLLNAGLELRKRLFPQHSVTDETRALCNELERIAGTARTLAVQLKHPHGQACAAELQLAGRIWTMQRLHNTRTHTHVEQCHDERAEKQTRQRTTRTRAWWSASWRWRRAWPRRTAT